MLVLFRESSGRLMPLKTGAKSVCNDGLFWHEASQLPTAKRSALKYVAVKAIASISPEVTIKKADLSNKLRCIAMPSKFIMGI